MLLKYKSFLNLLIIKKIMKKLQIYCIDLRKNKFIKETKWQVEKSLPKS